MSDTKALTLDRLAREWLTDAFDTPDEQAIVKVTSTATIRALMERHYDGGWDQFVADSPDTVSPLGKQILQALANDQA